MTDRKAMELALEALAAADDFLFNYHECEPNHEREMDAYSAIRANNHAAFTALRERLAQPEREHTGWRLVPIEPTKEMLRATEAGPVNYPSFCWSVMLSAAPNPLTALRGKHEHR